jgi:hypothetical protein
MPQGVQSTTGSSVVLSFAMFPTIVGRVTIARRD